MAAKLLGLASDGMFSPADLDSLGGETLLYLDTVLEALAQGSANAREIREALEPVSYRR
jgi:hypothetical protein